MKDAVAVRVSEDRVTGITKGRERWQLINGVHCSWRDGCVRPTVGSWGFCTSSSVEKLTWQISSPMGFAINAMRGRHGVVLATRVCNCQCNSMICRRKEVCENSSLPRRQILPVQSLSSLVNGFVLAPLDASRRHRSIGPPVLLHHHLTR